MSNVYMEPYHSARREIERLEEINADLLAVLKAMTEYMAYAEALGEDKAVFKNARAAIAKAEGKP